MHWMYGEGGWITMILFWAIIIVGIFFVARWVSSQMNNQRRNESALDTLKKRYARGEISKQEFENMKKDIE